MAQISSTHSKRVDKYCTQKQFDDNWDRIFKKKNKKEKVDEEQDTNVTTNSSTSRKSRTSG